MLRVVTQVSHREFKVRNVTFDTNIQHWNDRSDPRVLKNDFVYFWNQIM